MSALNSLLLEGNLTQDVEFIEMATGKSLAKFTIASNRWFRTTNQEFVSEVLYLKVEVWGKLAISCKDYLKKGSAVKVIGSLRQNIWVDDEDKRHEKYFLNAEYVDFKQPKKKVTNEVLDYQEDDKEKPKKKKKIS